MKLYSCPECNKDGFIEQLVCCGKGKYHGCCGDPDIEPVICPSCAGKCQVNLETFREFAINSRNPKVIAEYEMILLLEQLPMQQKSIEQSQMI